jgi:asparagine synthetase B (glutamine-hydrolysing)
MPSYFLLYQMITAAAEHGRVLITGDGGDEVFLGYRPPADWRSHQLRGHKATFIKVGSGPSDWMGTWARDVSGNTLVGHMLAKADRASAEQGVELRCPLLDFELISYVRSLPFAVLAGDGTLKPLLKGQLCGWPDWFLGRPKLGFAFNLRWRWALACFEGLRESVSQEALEWFDDRIPSHFRLPPRRWTSKNIIENFSTAWKLLAWSLFLKRASEAVSSSPQCFLQQGPQVMLREPL